MQVNSSLCGMEVRPHLMRGTRMVNKQPQDCHSSPCIGKQLSGCPQTWHSAAVRGKCQPSRRGLFGAGGSCTRELPKRVRGAEP